MEILQGYYFLFPEESLAQLIGQFIRMWEGWGSNAARGDSFVRLPLSAISGYGPHQAYGGIFKVSSRKPHHPEVGFEPAVRVRVKNLKIQKKN